MMIEKGIGSGFDDTGYKLPPHINTVVSLGSIASGSDDEKWVPPRLQPLVVLNTDPRKETTTEGRDLPSVPYPW